MFFLLPEVFNAAANNLVTVMQNSSTGKAQKPFTWQGIAEINAVSLPVAHYTVMEARSLFPMGFCSEAAGVHSLPFCQYAPLER